MATPPSMLQEGTDLPQAYALINDNFRKVVGDIGDLGGKTSSTASSNTGLLAPGDRYYIAIGITDNGHLYAGGIANLSPKFDIFVDNSNDFNFIYNNGPSLTTEQKKSFVIFTWFGLAPPNNYLGVFYLTILNNGVNNHTYYFNFAVDFVPKAVSGEFR